MRHNLDKIATLILRFVLPIFAFTIPLFFLPITPNFFDYNKIYLIYVLASISMTAWTVRIIARRRLHITLTPSTLSLIALGALYILSSIFQSPTPLLSLLGRTSVIVSLIIIYVSITTTQKNEKIIHATIYSFSFSLLILSVLSLFQYFGILERLVNYAPLQDKSFSLVGGIYSYLTLSFALLPGLIYLVLKSKHFFARLFFAITAAITVTSAITQISLLIPSGQSFTWPFLPFSVGWEIAIDTLKNIRTFFLGTGPDNFLSTFTRLRPATMNLSDLWNARFTNSSNELFNVISTTGFLGGILWLSTFLRTFNKIRSNISTPYFAFSSLTLLSVFIISLIIPANIILLSTIFISLTLTSLCLKLSTGSHTKDFTLNLFTTSSPSTAKEYEQLPVEKSSVNQVLVFFFSLPSVLLLVFFWYFSIRAYLASVATYQALLLINTNAGASYEKQIVAYNLDPFNPTYRINFSQTSLALANSIAGQKELTEQDKNNISQLVQQAIREAKNATQLNSQNVIGWENLAQTYNQLTNFAQGAVDWTIASYNQAILLDPTNPSLRLSLGSVFYSLQDFDSAIKLFGQAVDLKPNWANAHYNLSSAYKANNNIKKAVEEMRIVVQLVDPNSQDFQKAQTELSDLEKQLPKEASSQTVPSNSTVELVTPTPIPNPSPKIKLPENGGPEIPLASPTPTP